MISKKDLFESSEELIDSLSFCVIDLETTGGNHENDQIIEIGIVNVDKRKIVLEKDFLINPGREIPEFIQRLTHIKNKDVEGCPKIEDLIDEVLEIIGDRIIVAHNASFDVPFINAVIKKLGRAELKNKVLCTNIMTKHLIPEIMNSNLSYMSRLFKIDLGHAHRANADARATAELLINYLNIFINKGIRKINQLYYPRNKFELDRVHLEDHFELVFEITKKLPIPMNIIIKGEQGLILGILPLQNPSEEQEIIRSFLNSCDFKMITLKFSSNILEGVFSFNNHYQKYDEAPKKLVFDYLTNKYQSQDSQINLEQLDFIAAPHLIKEQVMIYSFLNLKTNGHAIFKLPGHKKKMSQYLKNQIIHFKSNQKGRKNHSIHPDLIKLVEGIIDTGLNHEKTKDYLLLQRKSLEENQEGASDQIELFLREQKRIYNFPEMHL